MGLQLCSCDHALLLAPAASPISAATSPHPVGLVHLQATPVLPPPNRVPFPPPLRLLGCWRLRRWLGMAGCASEGAFCGVRRALLQLHPLLLDLPALFPLLGKGLCLACSRAGRVTRGGAHTFNRQPSLLCARCGEARRRVRQGTRTGDTAQQSGRGAMWVPRCGEPCRLLGD